MLKAIEQAPNGTWKLLVDLFRFLPAFCVPFRSEAQRRFLWAKHPEIAKRWAHEYPGQHDLPRHSRKGVNTGKRDRLTGIKKNSSGGVGEENGNDSQINILGGDNLKLASQISLRMLKSSATPVQEKAMKALQIATTPKINSAATQKVDIDDLLDSSQIDSDEGGDGNNTGVNPLEKAAYDKLAYVLAPRIAQMYNVPQVSQDTTSAAAQGGFMVDPQQSLPAEPANQLAAISAPASLGSGAPAAPSGAAAAGSNSTPVTAGEPDQSEILGGSLRSAT